MVLEHEFGKKVSGKSVLRVMRRLGLHCKIRSHNPWRKYSSFKGVFGEPVPNLLQRDFHADHPFEKLGTDVTEFKVAGGKAYLAPVYDMGSKEIVCWDISQRPDFKQQERLLARLKKRLPKGVHPILHSDMGWQYQNRRWRRRLKKMGIRQSMSRKGNCLDNAATEQVFGHLKDEFYTHREDEFTSFKQFKRALTRFIRYWNRKRRQEAIGGHTPEEYRRMALEA